MSSKLILVFICTLILSTGYSQTDNIIISDKHHVETDKVEFYQTKVITILTMSSPSSITEVSLPDKAVTRLKNMGFTSSPVNTYEMRLSKDDDYQIIHTRKFYDGYDYAILIVAEDGVSDVDGRLENYTTDNLIASSVSGNDKFFILEYSPTYDNNVEIYAKVYSAASDYTKYQIKAYIYWK